jgi:hypothetical protein
MNRYPKSPRVAFGFAAAALCALTFGAAVVAPATTLAARQTAPTLAATAAASGAKVVAINPSRIEVVGVRSATLADARSPANPSRRQPS